MTSLRINHLVLLFALAFLPTVASAEGVEFMYNRVDQPGLVKLLVVGPAFVGSDEVEITVKGTVAAAKFTLSKTVTPGDIVTIQTTVFGSQYGDVASGTWLLISRRQVTDEVVIESIEVSIRRGAETSTMRVERPVAGDEYY